MINSPRVIYHWTVAAGAEFSGSPVLGLAVETNIYHVGTWLGTRIGYLYTSNKNDSDTRSVHGIGVRVVKNTVMCVTAKGE